MATLIEIEIPEYLVQKLHDVVNQGIVEDIDAIVVKAVQREIHRIQNEQDIEILRMHGGNFDPDLDAWVAFGAKTTFEDLD